MNIFRFLKNTQGAIKPLNALVISGLAGVGFFYVANTAANKHLEANRATRSLTSISQTAPQAGMRRRGNSLTSINVRDGRNQLATPEERAAMEGKSALDRYVANQRALGSMDEALARAAQFSDSDGGLNTGNRNAVQTPTQLEVGNPNASTAGNPQTRATSPAGPSGQTGGTVAAPAPAGHFAVSTPAAAATGGISVQGGNTAEGGRLSGAMPGGSNIVSQRGLDGALARGNNTSSFASGRNGHLTRARSSTGERDELKDIVKRSAEATGNIHASANEGGRAFLANAVVSGGIDVSGEEDITRGASSEDLTTPTKRKLKAVGDQLSDLEKKLAKRDEDHKHLRNLLIGVVLGSAAMMLAGAILLPKLNSYPWLRWGVAGAMIAAVAAANVVLFVKAVEFMNRYKDTGGTGLAELSLILSPIMVAGMVFTAINPEGWKSLGTKIWSRVKQAFEPVGLLTSQVTSRVTSLFSKK